MQLIIERRIAIILIDIFISKLLCRKMRIKFSYRLTLSNIVNNLRMSSIQFFITVVSRKRLQVYIYREFISDFILIKILKLFTEN